MTKEEGYEDVRIETLAVEITNRVLQMRTRYKHIILAPVIPHALHRINKNAVAEKNSRLWNTVILVVMRKLTCRDS